MKGKKLGLGIVLLLAVAAGVFAQTQPGRTIDEYTRIIRSNPNDSLAYAYRGAAYLGNGDYDRAIADLTQAIRLDPNFAGAYNERGFTYNRKGDYDRAIADLTQAIRLNPNFTNAYLSRGAAYSFKGDHDRGIADLTQAIQLNPNFAGAYVNRGGTYNNKGDYDRGIADLTQAIRIDPSFVIAYHNRSSAYIEKGDYDRAIADFTQAIRIDPNFANAYSGRGSAYNRKNDYDRAIADYTEAIRLDPIFAIAYSSRGNTYNQKGDYDRAIADCTEAIRLNPNSANPYRHRAFAYMNKGNFTQARNDVNKALQINPNYENAQTLSEELRQKETPIAQRQQQQTAPNGFVRIDGGTFTMGSPANEPGRRDDEDQRQVTVSSFYMGKYEVTQKEYQEVMGTNPSDYKGNNLPVEQVSWYDAIEYCNARSRKEGLTPAYTIDKSRKDPNNKNDNDVKWIVTWNRNANGYRLPTEAEWEYACRAGTTTAYHTGASITNNTGWYKDNSDEKTHPVGQKSANAWGLYDMHGNVNEWCWDWYAGYPSGAQTNPVGASSGSNRVSRGGNWSESARHVRSASRVSLTPSYWFGPLGFRVVRP